MTMPIPNLTTPVAHPALGTAFRRKGAESFGLFYLYRVEIVPSGTVMLSLQTESGQCDTSTPLYRLWEMYEEDHG